MAYTYLNSVQPKAEARDGKLHPKLLNSGVALTQMGSKMKENVRRSKFWTLWSPLPYRYICNMRTQVNLQSGHRGTRVLTAVLISTLGDIF